MADTKFSFQEIGRAYSPAWMSPEGEEDEGGGETIDYGDAKRIVRNMPHPVRNVGLEGRLVQPVEWELQGGYIAG